MNDQDLERVRASNHARNRWISRGTTAMPVERALRQSVPVGADDVVGSARLHPPTGTLLVIKNRTIITVLIAEPIELNDDHLIVCGECGLRWHPGMDDGCPWCAPDATAESTEAVNT